MSLPVDDVDDELAKIIPTDFQPFTFVVDRSFKTFVKAFNPTYTPQEKTLTQTTIA